MISALLLPLLFAADTGLFQPAVAANDDPPVELWINNDRRFLPGDRAKVQVRTEEDGYLVVLHVDPEGYLRVLFPLDPDKDNFVRGGRKYEVKGRGGREAFEADSRGQGTVYAAVSREPFRFDGFVTGDHWDYRALAPSRLSSNPESELNELVRRMAQGDFDYDLLNYDVVERSAYVYDSPRYYGSLYDDPWCYSFCGRAYYGSPFSVSIFLGRPYRRYYYDPYFYAYDPFYNPFFYDPYYYAPAYYPRYVYPRHYYDYPYRNRWYYDRNHFGRSYSTYGFGHGFAGDYRDRRYGISSVNTVYRPPLSPVREPSIATPARRVIEGPAADLPDGPAPRRLIDNTSRVQGRPEARRARPADPAESRSAGEPRLIRRDVEARPSRSSAPDRSSASGRDDRREAPVIDRSREAPRSVERSPAREAPPRREVERASPPRSDPRSGGGASAGRSSGGGGHQSGGSRPESSGGRRPR